MATYYFTGNTNNYWGTATNWSTLSGGSGDGAVPTTTDNAIFDSNSPSCTVNTSNRVCASLDFTGYNNTITMSKKITVSGNVTLSSTMTISGSETLAVDSSATLTSNGKSWPNTLQLDVANTWTLADNWIVGTLTTNATGGTRTINNYTLSITGNLSGVGEFAGSANIELSGTGTWNNTGKISNNLTINTSGTVTISNIIYDGLDSGTIAYTSGTINQTGTMSIKRATINLNGVTWGNILMGQTSSFTNTLTSNLTCTNLTIGSSTETVTINSYQISIIGSLTLAGTGTSDGSTSIVLNGTGTWSGSRTLKNNLTINSSSGTITISGSVTYNTGTLTYTAGTITSTGSTLICSAATTFNTGTMIWQNITFSGNNTKTINSSLKIRGVFSLSTASTFSGSGGILVDSSL